MSRLLALIAGVVFSASAFATPWYLTPNTITSFGMIEGFEFQLKLDDDGAVQTDFIMDGQFFYDDNLNDYHNQCKFVITGGDVLWFYSCSDSSTNGQYLGPSESTSQEVTFQMMQIEQHFIGQYMLHLASTEDAVVSLKYKIGDDEGIMYVDGVEHANLEEAQLEFNMFGLSRDFTVGQFFGDESSSDGMLKDLRIALVGPYMNAGGEYGISTTKSAIHKQLEQFNATNDQYGVNGSWGGNMVEADHMPTYGDYIFFDKDLYRPQEQ